MSDSKVKLLLFLTILMVSVLPLLAALYLLDRSLQTSLNLGFNPEVAEALEDSSRTPDGELELCVANCKSAAFGD